MFKNREYAASTWTLLDKQIAIENDFDALRDFGLERPSDVEEAMLVANIPVFFLIKLTKGPKLEWTRAQSETAISAPHSSRVRRTIEPKTGAREKSCSLLMIWAGGWGTYGDQN